MSNNLIRTLKGEKTDKIPFWEVWFLERGELARKVLGGCIDCVEKEIEVAKHFGYDCARINGVARPLPGNMGLTSEGKEHYIGGGLHDLTQLENLPPLDIDKIRREMSGKVKKIHDVGLAAIMYQPWCFHAVNTSMGLENFSMKVYDDIDFLHAAFDYIEDSNRLMIEEVAIPLGMDAVMFDGDCAYKNGLMISPEIFRELVFERTKNTVAPLKEAGIPYTLHSDGKLDEVIPVLIELGFSGVHGIEAAANDLKDIKERFGKDITLIGNMDITFLGYATLDKVRTETKKMLDIGSPGGRYIAACNTSPEDFIPLDNYEAFAEVIRNY